MVEGENLLKFVVLLKYKGNYNVSIANW